MEFRNRLEYWREKAGYKSKAEFTREANLPYRLYLSWTNLNCKEEPGVNNLLKARKALRKRIPTITLDDLIEEISSD